MELDWLKKWSTYSPQKTALRDGDTGRQLSYLQLFVTAKKGAAILSQEWNIEPGDRVAALCSNSLEFIILFFSLNRLGATLVPINTRLKGPEISHILADSTPKVIFFDSETLLSLEKLISNGEPKTWSPVSLVDWSSDLHNCQNEFSEFKAVDDSLAFILYTSGTTGSPKGAMITFANLFWNSINTSIGLDITQHDRAVIFLPLFHTGGWNVLTTPFFHRGAEIILIKKFEANQVLDLTTGQKCTLLFGVPTTMDMMSQCPAFEKSSFESLRFAIVGGEPMPTQLIKKWHQKGVPIRQGYGLTEFGPNVFSLSEQDAIRKKGSVGFPNFYVQARILNADREDCATDEIGELALKGPVAMQGYWNNPTATAESFCQGWLLTGDLVRKDTDGYFFVVGRRKEMFISGGENVYPAEIEEALRKIPGIQEVAVIGVPDEKWGEVGKAFIVTQADQAEVLDRLRLFTQNNLAGFKIPKHFQFLESLPKNESGKILKRMLSLQ